MKVTSMPDASDIPGCLEALAFMYGDEWAFKFIGGVRDYAANDDAAGTVRIALARRMLAEELKVTSDQDEARRNLAERLGYTALTRTNFYKILTGKSRKGNEKPGTYA